MSDNEQPEAPKAETPIVPMAVDPALIAPELRASGAPMDDRDAIHLSEPLRETARKNEQ